MLRTSTGAWVASVSSVLAFGLLSLSSTSTRAHATEPYPAVVHAYRNLDGEAVARLRALTVDQVDEGVRAAIAGTPQPWDWKDLRAAAMLHTEAWYLARAEGARDEAARQLLQAERLLGAVTDFEPQQLYFAERWCKALPVLLLRGSSRPAEALRDACNRRWPLSRPAKRASDLFDLALFSEARLFGPDSPGVTRTSDPLVRQRMDRLARMYQAVLTEDRQHAAAALRLGNLRAGLGQEAAAMEHFTVASRSFDPRIRYLAFLFVGQIHNRNGRLDDAERFYRAAIGQYPAAPSAVYALCELLGRRGREAESKGRLLDLLGQGRHVDPLWTFRLPPGQSASLQLDELRIEVRQ
jgi:tetratricopeptide (TPR) repeat protein